MAFDINQYLNTRRTGWPYEDSYHVECPGNHRFVAKIGDEIAGLSYAEVSEDGSEALMKMNLKAEYAEYGIGTELLNLLMSDLKDSGLEIIRYNLTPERYAFQIFDKLGLKAEGQYGEMINLVWRKTNG